MGVVKKDIKVEVISYEIMGHAERDEAVIIASGDGHKGVVTLVFKNDDMFDIVGRLLEGLYERAPDGMVETIKTWLAAHPVVS